MSSTIVASQRHSIWTLFKQQRLPAWQPILTPLHSALCLLAVAVVCLPLSVALFQANSTAADITVRYDNQQRCSFAFNSTGAFRYEASPEQVWQTGCVTDVSFRITRHLKAPIYLYYGLENFYQNHRRFSNSKSDAQLSGQQVSVRSLAAATSPVTHPGSLRGTENSSIEWLGSHHRYGDFVYAPAGLIPWSLFNDTFALFRVEGDESSETAALYLICNGSAFSRFTNDPLADAGRCHKKGIAWTTDVDVKYKKPLFPSSPTPHPVWSAPQWAYDVPDGDKSSSSPPPTPLPSNDAYFNNGWYANEPGHRIPVTTDEDLMVWARVASMPSFRKLYRVIDEDLEPGMYLMRIDEHFDAASIGGKKSFSLATLSWLGGRNSFMAWMYLTIGGVSAVSGLLFLSLHRWYGDRALRAVAALLKED